MTKRVAIINQAGFDKLGAETLCLRYADIGLSAWFKSDVRPDYASSPNIHIYSNVDALIDMAENYDRLIFINLWFGVDIPETIFDDIITLKNKYPNKEFCYIHCARVMLHINKMLPIFDRHNFMFDHIFSLCNGMKSFDRCPVTIMKLNALDILDYNPVPFSERKNIVYTSGRVAAFKGTSRYFKSVNDTFLSRMGNFKYVHEGANFNFHKNDDGVSSSVTLLSLFNTAKHPKELKPEYTFKRYGDDPQSGKLNIYPSYDLESAQERWRTYYAGICCILGTESRYIVRNTLFGDDCVLENPRENTIIEKSAELWNGDLEYADIEKLSMGVPVFFSRRYAQILGFTDTRLIYDCFADIPDKVNQLADCYDEVRQNQWDWFVNSARNTNADIIKIFTSDFNKQEV